MKKSMLGIMILCVSFAGCGSGNSAPSANLTGDWQFTAYSMMYGYDIAGSGPLQQNGNSISGTVNLTGDVCAISAVPISGNVSGASVTLQLEEGNQAVKLTGTVNAAGTSIGGNYSAPSGGCTDGDYGTWSGTKM